MLTLGGFTFWKMGITEVVLQALMLLVETAVMVPKLTEVLFVGGPTNKVGVVTRLPVMLSHDICEAPVVVVPIATNVGVVQVKVWVRMLADKEGLVVFCKIESAKAVWQPPGLSTITVHVPGVAVVNEPPALVNELGPAAALV
jgi:hypothetical protein